MIKLLMLLSVFLAIGAEAQTQPKKSGKIIKPPPSENELRAMAKTNFTAQCAVFFDWKTATNNIAVTTGKILENNRQQIALREKITLAAVARTPSEAFQDDLRQKGLEYRNLSQSLAANKLRKIQIEEQLHKMYPKAK